MDSAPGDADATSRASGAGRASAAVASIGARIVADARVLVPLLILFESLHWVFARVLVPLAPPATAGLYMMALATAQVGFVARRHIRPATLVRHVPFFATIGVLVGVNTNLGFVAMRYVDPGTAALLTRTSVVFGVALGLVWLGERLSRAELAGAVVAMAGVFVVAFQPGEYFQLGSLLVVLSALLYAVHSAVVKRWGADIAFVDFFFYRLGSTAVVLLLLAAAQDAIVAIAPRAFIVLVVAATFNVVVSRALYYLALRRLPMSRLTIMITLSPVVTILWSASLFGSRPSLQEVSGGIAILAGVVVVITSRGGRI